MKKIILATVLLSAVSSLCVSEASPLLMDGKKSIYERVLTTPECRLKAQTGDQDGKAVPAFTRYYVYERNAKWLKVGSDTADHIAGYIDSSCAVPWKAQTALMFTNPAGRSRAAVFASKDELAALAEDPDGAKKYRELNESLDKQGQASGVIAREPENYVDYQKNFYLLPVLSSSEIMLEDGTYARELEIASVTRQGLKQQSSANDPGRIKAFKAALVFVIDSSISMQPYIDRTKQAVNSIYRQLEKQHLQNSVHFGLVSFRSNTQAVPALQYTSKTFVKPGEVSSAKAFEDKVRTLSQAKASSALFDEDAYAGINTALSDIDWSGYGGRYIVLITDAGAISGSDKLSSTKLDSKELRLEARHQGVAVYALHLLTKAGEKAGDHDKARSQYEDLTYNEVVQKPLYYQVAAGDVNAFGSMVDSLASSIASQVKLASEGKLGTGSADMSKSSMDNDLELLGQAMVLAYLGSSGSASAPAFYKGWILDRDLGAPTRSCATPVVLLTKSELSDLKDVTARILDAAGRGILAPDDMFAQLRSAAAAMGRDPNALKSQNSLKLSEMGLLGEYLEDLPYKSRIQELDEDSWSAMGPDEQNRLIEDLEQKLQFYQKCNDDHDRWVKLAKDAPAFESVYPIPLEALP